MKLKSLLVTISLWLGLLIIPTHGNAQQTYGYFNTKSMAGFIYVTVINGKNVPTDLNLEGTSSTSYWYAQVYTVSVFSNTKDAQSNKHSVLKALMVFTGGQYNWEPAYAEVDITVNANGSQTIGALITDYYTGKTLFSTGSVASSTPPSILQLPLLSGGFQIAL